MKKGKLFAPFLTLFASAVTLCIMLYFRYKLVRIAWTLLIVVIVFYVIGTLITNRVSGFIKTNEEQAREEEEKEGEVIEKDAPQTDESESEESYKLPPLTGETPIVPGQANDQSGNMFRERN